MSYTLFLDDLREPTVTLVNVKIARNVSEAIRLIKNNGLPDVISLDHDLGSGEPVATQFLSWLIDQHLDKLLDANNIKQVFIHSANPVGSRNLKGIWNGFAKCELSSGVVAIINTRYD